MTPMKGDSAARFEVKKKKKKGMKLNMSNGECWGGRGGKLKVNKNVIEQD